MSKGPKDSAIDMYQLVMPNQTNPLNTIFGGQVMSWIDLAAAMAASRHSGKPVVTVHVDSISFLAPIKVGDHVRIMASVNYVGKTSLEVGCKVIAEDPISGKSEHTTSAYLTFVAIDDRGKPSPVTPLALTTAEEKRRNRAAKERLKHRKTLRKKLEK